MVYRFWRRLGAAEVTSHRGHTRISQRAQTLSRQWPILPSSSLSLSLYPFPIFLHCVLQKPTRASFHRVVQTHPSSLSGTVVGFDFRRQSITRRFIPVKLPPFRFLSSKERKSVSFVALFLAEERNTPSLCPSRLARVRGIIPKGIRLIGYEIRRHLEKLGLDRELLRFRWILLENFASASFLFLLTSLVDSNQEQERDGRREGKGGRGEAKEKLPLPGMEVERIVLDDRRA